MVTQPTWKPFGAVSFIVLIAALIGLAWTMPALAVSGAGFTTVNEGVDGPGHCKNGNPNVNCNIYDGKQYVWLNGGPVSASLGDGTYFFAVLAPGGQADPNDGTANNLSDPPGGDAYTNRTFSVSNGTVSYSGSHDFDLTSNKIRLIPYDDTTNPGGVYILAICSLADGYPVDPHNCKYDAFKIVSADCTDCNAPVDLTVTKDATADVAYTWTITKDVDKTFVEQVGGSATFNYTVKVKHDAGGGTVSGNITIVNPNTIDVDILSVADVLTSGNATCDVTDSQGQALVYPLTVTAVGTLDLTYSCGGYTPTADGKDTNTVTITWDNSVLGAPNDSASFAKDFTADTTDECVDVTDSYKGKLGTVCVGDANPTTFTYSRTVQIPSFGCQTYDNTATFTTNDTGATGSASQTVKVCGAVRTGGLTMGFWQNKNGQDIITKGASTAGVCNSGTWLRQYTPFQDLSATATCNAVGTYVTNIIKAANASGASMNAMLKAQMLATALDVYFSTPGLGGNKINAPGPIGAVSIDLTKVCANPVACSSYINASGAFNGAASLTVSEILSYAASQSNSGGSVWYGQVKATQEKAKDVFDAINNQVAFAP